MKFKIKSRFSGKVLFELECGSFKICLQKAINSKANLRWADLRGANLRWADLRGADLRWANLSEADLRWADLRGADLRGADLRWANLSEADLRGADLRWANLSEADLAFSCWPLWCGSFKAKADDKLVAQLIHHVAKLNTENCSGGVKESMEFIRKMAISDLFTEYRNDVERMQE